MLRDLVLKCRSYRRFYESEEIPEDVLIGLVDLARVTASAANSQPLRYRIVREEKEKAQVFGTLAWAAALKDWGGPAPGERPAAYIIMLDDLTIAQNRSCDAGIAAQTILLGAVEQGYGGCMLANVRKKELMASLGLDPERYAVELVIALGKPKEDVRLTETGPDGRTTYYRDGNQIHYVPKRPLEEVLLRGTRLESERSAPGDI